MAELTAEQKEIASLKAKLAESESAKSKLIEAAKGADIAMPVEGSFAASLRKDGKTVELKFGFKDGYRFVRDEKGTIYPADVVMHMAKGNELTQAVAKEFPTVVSLTKESAQGILQRLAELEYAGLTEVK